MHQAVPTQYVTGFPISTLSFDRHVNVIMQWAQSKRESRMVCVSNVHMLMEGHWNPGFAKVLMQADMLTPDGMPLAWMASLMKGGSQDRVAGMELMKALCEQAQQLGLCVFFLGSTPEILSIIHKKLKRDFPDLHIAGMLSPPFRAITAQEDEEMTSQINRSGADLVFVSLGCPKQERWMSEHKDRIGSVMVGLGGAFLVFAGVQPWAPRFVRKLGLEWCYRLVQEPKRLWKRYASTIPPFMLLALKQVVKVRLGVPPDVSLRKKNIHF